jgi:Protein of unknown function (DUF4232)
MKTAPREGGIMIVARSARPIAGVAALFAAGLLTACSGAGGHPRADSESAGHLKASPTPPPQYLPPSSPAAVTTPAAASPAPSLAQPTAPSTTTAPPQPLTAGPGPCSTGGLRVTIGPANGAAGSLYYPLLFTNVSGAACTLYGYPGAAFVTGPGGTVIGGAAVRNPTFPKALVTLAPGGVAHASLQVAVAANYPAATCKPVTAHWLRVFPPGQYAARPVALTAQTCSDSVPSGSTLGIYVVRPGATGP